MADRLTIDTLTLGEVAKVEKMSGQAISAIADDDRPKGLTLAALAFVAKRRTDPTFSWNDAQALTLGQLGELVDWQGDDEDDDEDEGDDSGKD